MLGLGKHQTGTTHIFGVDCQREPPYQRTSKEAKEDAIKIRSLSCERIRRHARKHAGLLEDPEDLVKFAEEWDQFLETCGGYEVLE